MDSYLYIVDKSGSGDVHIMLLVTSGSDVVYKKFKTERWETTSDVTNFEIAVIDNILFVVGGFDKITAKPLARLLRFDPSKGQWSECKPMPTPRMKCTAVVKDKRIYVIGGEKVGGIPSSRTEIYDPISDSWEKVGSMPSPRLRPAITLMEDGSLFCVGGSYKGIIRNNMWIFKDKKWHELDDNFPQTLSTSLDKTALISVGETVFVIGGITSKMDHKGKTFLHTNPRMFALKPVIFRNRPDQKLLDLPSSWEILLPSPQHPRYNAAHLIVGSKIYLLGGTNFETGQAVTPVESYNTTTKEWETEFRIVKDNICDVSCVVLRKSKEAEANSHKPARNSSNILNGYVLW